MQYINPEEVIKRLAASQGIDVLNLVKGQAEVQGEQQQAMQSQQEQEMAMQQEKNAPAMASTPMNDPSKNPALEKQLNGE